MKFFWKLYLSIMLITITFFSIGGYFLIQSSFHNSLEREIESVYKENDIYISSLQREFNIPIDDQEDSTLVIKPVSYTHLDVYKRQNNPLWC